MQTATTWESDEDELHLGVLAPANGPHCPADVDIEESRPSLLDAIVARANRFTFFEVHYHPYWIMSDVAAISSLIYAWIFAARFPQLSGAALAFAVLVALLIYKLVLEIKSAFGKTAARSFLQD